LVAAELLNFNIPYLVRSHADPRAAAAPAQAVEHLTPTGRVSVLTLSPGAKNMFISSRVADIGGYENSVLHRYDSFLRAATGRQGWQNVYLQIGYQSQLYDRLNVNRVIFPVGEGMPPSPSDCRQLSGPVLQDAVASYAVFGRDGAVPARLAYGFELADSVDSAVAKAVDNLRTRNPSVVLEVEPVPSPEPPPPDRHESLSVVSAEPGKIDISCDLPSAGILVIPENIYPGWTVTVDGEEAELLAADGFMLAVSLPAGSHNVAFRYAPTKFGLWAMFSAVGLLISLAMLALPVRPQSE
jgi:hypothetical protein